MSDSVRPHRWQPTRLPCPWDSPGKNTGVDCHFLLQCMKVKSESEVAQLCPTLRDPMDCSLPGSSVHGIFQARALEWGAIAFKSHLPSAWNSESHIVIQNSLQPHGLKPARLLCPWDSPGKLPCLPPEDLPDPGTEPGSPVLQADSLTFEPTWNPKCILISKRFSPLDWKSFFTYLLLSSAVFKSLFIVTSNFKSFSRSVELKLFILTVNMEIP